MSSGGRDDLAQNAGEPRALDPAEPPLQQQHEQAVH